MKKITPLIKRYLPDSLILLGILIFSYNYLRPVTLVCSLRYCNRIDGIGYVPDHHIGLKVLGIMLFATGLVFAIRRYLSLKRN